MPASPATAKPSHDADQSAVVPTDQTMPCYVIGLPDMPERWQPTIAAMEKMGLQVQLWPATDGRQGQPAPAIGRTHHLTIPSLGAGAHPHAGPRTWLFSISLPTAAALPGCRLSSFCRLRGRHFPELGHLPQALEAIAGLDDSYAIVHLDPCYARYYIQRAYRAGQTQRHIGQRDDALARRPSARSRRVSQDTRPCLPSSDSHHIIGPTDAHLHNLRYAIAQPYRDSSLVVIVGSSGSTYQRHPQHY